MGDGLNRVFVGGSGRSGTTVLGRLIGAHPLCWSVTPTEVRFLTDRGGLLDVIDSQTAASNPVSPPADSAHSFDDFVHRLKTYWWNRVGPDGGARGLHLGVDLAAFSIRLDRFVEAYLEAGQVRATELVAGLLDPVAAGNGARTWVETTPDNAANAGRLISLATNTRVIHIFRDGRDVSTSVVRLPWGPTHLGEALEWWRMRVLRAHRAIISADPSRVLSLCLEDLVLHRREESYGSLLDFLELHDHPEIRTYFDQHVTPDSAHIGRWQGEVPQSELGQFERRYREIWIEMSEAGLAVPYPGEPH